MTSIRLHSKHGVNPTCGVCFWCGKKDGTIALLGAAYPGEAPRSMILGYDPCAACQEAFAKGIVLFVCSEQLDRPGLQAINGRNAAPPAYPTGEHFVITEDAARRLLQREDVLESVLKHRKAFVDEEVAAMLRGVKAQ